MFLIIYVHFIHIGMTGVLLSIDYTIGYISSSEMRKSDLKYAKIQNFQGNFLGPDNDSVQNALADAKFDNKFNIDITVSLYIYFVLMLK